MKWTQDEIDDMYEDDDLDPEDEWEFDCHMDRHGQCGKAGSEECDFECPVMNEIIRQEALKRLRRKKPTPDPKEGA